SDFYDLEKQCEPHLFALAKHCNVNFCQVYDSLEQQLPEPALYAVSNGEQQALLNTGDQNLRDNFADRYTQREDYLRKLSEQLYAGLLAFDTSNPIMRTLAKAYGKRRFHS
ncbi:MAG: hypothetical protein ACPHK5_02670, partial [Porticoccaceae bacterium]